MVQREHFPSYDIVICVGPQHLDIVQTTISYINKYLNPEKIIVITNKNYFHHFSNLQKSWGNLFLTDENKLNAELTYQSIEGFLKGKIDNGERAGWYFQQFLKMEVCKIIFSDYYLIWDADTIPLYKINFFKKGNSKILVQPSRENHIPYFNTLKKILNITKLSSTSFISEHFMISKEIMLSLIKQLEKESDATHWSKFILNHIEKKDLPFSGFSEYETYGNYTLKYFPNIIQIRTAKEDILNSYRFGAQLFGPSPSYASLKLLHSLEYHYVTFEVWNKGNPKEIWKNKVLARLFLLTNKNILFSWATRRIKQKISKQMGV